MQGSLPPTRLYTISHSSLKVNLHQRSQLTRQRPSRLTPSGKIKRQAKNPSSVPAPTIFFFCLLQIQEFSSGFWDGTKLACWMKGQTPWQFFPKLSLYLRATNTSQSFRITILPQVPGQTRTPPSVRPRPAVLILISLLLVLSVFSQLYIQQITDVDGTLDCFRFGVSSSVNGLVIGATVMEGFYVVFDRAQRRVGFALSSCAGEDTGYVPNPEPSL